MSRSKLGVKSSYNIPQELLTEILLQLPFYSLVSCKLVSKQWKHLICDPKFYRLYRNKSVALQFSGNRLLCLLTRQTLSPTNGHRFPPYTVHRVPLAPTSDNGYKDFELLSGSSGSIACVKMPRHDYRFYNLITGASHTVRAPPKQGDCYRCWVCFGFGYDRHSDDYKILEVFIKYPKSQKFLIREMGAKLDMDTDCFWVYSFGARRWKSLNGYPYDLYERPICNNAAACSFDGFLHWVVLKRGTIRERVVLTYDFHACKFGEMSLPTPHAQRVSELDGRLCCVGQTKASLCVWVMQEYGVAKSWTKLFAFDAKRSSAVGTMVLEATPAMLYECGDGGKAVLFTRRAGDPRMFWYDIDKMKIEEVQDPSMRRTGIA